jgi:peptide chain release factor 2
MQMLKSHYKERLNCKKQNAARDEIESGKMKIEWGSQHNYVYCIPKVDKGCQNCS